MARPDPTVDVSPPGPPGDDETALDIPYRERGVDPPLYYNPKFPSLKFFVNGVHDGLRVVLWIGTVKEGIYRYDTPRQEQWVRANVSKHLGGNAPDRWMGDNLEEDDRWHCADCQFTTRNTKVASDHRRHWGHTERLLR